MRIIGRLDIKSQNLIKGINLEGLRVVGNPNKFALKYYNEGIDELIFMDVVASLYKRDNILEIIKSASKDIFIPITVGGGIRGIDDAYNLFKSGADKIAINSAIVKNIKLLADLSSTFGSQSIVGSIEAKKKDTNSWEIYTNNGRDSTDIDLIDWVKKLEDYGAGELLVTSIDKEGTREGFDLEMIKIVKENTSLPVILSGGFGKLDDIKTLNQSSKVEAIAIADCIHFNRIKINEIRNQCINCGIEIRKL